jgi:hypothetical protein
VVQVVGVAKLSVAMVGVRPVGGVICDLTGVKGAEASDCCFCRSFNSAFSRRKASICGVVWHIVVSCGVV